MKLKEVLGIEDSIFTYMEELDENIMWKEDYDKEDMDLEFISKYGERTTAPLIDLLLENEELTIDSKKRLAKIIYNKHKERWSRKYQVLDVQYEVLDNYRMVENEEIDRDTLESTIQELLKTNSDHTEQINDLLEAVENNTDNTMTKSGTDTVGRQDTDTLTFDDRKDTIDGKILKTGTESDELSFLDRKDTETRDLEEEKTGKDTVTKDDSDTLTFTGRKDDTVGSVTKTGTDSEELSFLGRKDTETRDLEEGKTGKDTVTKNDTDSLTFIGRKDDNKGSINKTGTDKDKHVETESGSTIESTESEELTYGYNSGNTPTPSKKNTGENTVEPGKKTTTTDDKTLDLIDKTEDTTTKTGTEKHEIDGSDETSYGSINSDSGTVTTGKDGKETNKTTYDTIETKEDATTKTGSEKHAIDGLETTKYGTINNETGTLTKSIDGKETNSKTLNLTDKTDDSTTKTGSEINKITGEDTTTYGSIDTYNEEGGSSKTDSGTIDTTVIGSGSDNTTGSITGEINEIRNNTKSGNTGISTPELLQQHIDFWQHSFLDEVYKDVADMISLRVYA